MNYFPDALGVLISIKNTIKWCRSPVFIMSYSPECSGYNQGWKKPGSELKECEKM